MKKNYFKLVIFLFAFLTFIANIDAEFPNKIGPMGFGSNSPAYNGYNKFVFLKANDKAAYCVLYYADLPGEGNYCNLANDWSDPVKAGVAAIINKANASNSVMTKEYYYADLAMNEFLYVYNDEHNINNGISKKRRISTKEVLQYGQSDYMQYYDAAVAAYNKVKNGISVNLTRTGGKSSWNIDSDGADNVVNTYKISGTNADTNGYKVTATFVSKSSSNITATIMDANGQQKDTFNSGETFKVKINNISAGDSAKLKINVTGTMTYSVAANYKCGSGKQEITLNQVEAKTTSKSVYTNFTVKKDNNPQYPTLVVKKVNTNQETLSGVELLITKDGNEFEQLYTDQESSLTVEDLEAGRYCIKETKAPIGYNISSNEYCFDVSLDDSNVASVSLSSPNLDVDRSNTPNIVILTLPNNKNLIKINKVDEKGNGLSGVQLSIKKYDGSYATTIDGELLNNTNSNLLTTGTPIRIRGLAPGNYYLVEESVPNGYTKSQPVSFTVEDNRTLDQIEDGETLTVNVTMKNEKTVLNIDKVDIINRQSIKGAVLEIRDENCQNVVKIDGNPVRWTSDGNTHSIVGLTANRNYCLKETEVPNGYKTINNGEIKFKIDSYGAVIVNNEVQNDTTVIMENEHKIYISKKDLTSGDELAGAHLQLSDSNNTVIEEWVSTNEKYEIKANLGVGQYKLRETIAPDGYVLSEEEIIFKINKDGSITVNNEKAKDSLIVMTNDYNRVYISKQDITNKEELPGAHLVITDQDGNTIKDGDWVSTTEPHLLEGLNPGTYTITEVTAPDGYTRNEEKVTFTVDKNGAVSGNTVMYNTPIPEVPSTLSTQSVIIIVVGVLLLGVGTGLYIYSIKKNKIKKA